MTVTAAMPVIPAAGQAHPGQADAPALHPSALMNEEQAELLSTLVSSMRPGWHPRGIMKALERSAREADAITLTMALLHAAKDQNNQTPAIINHPGPHWDKARGTHTPKPTPKPTVTTIGSDTSAMCPKHPHLHTWECKACRVKAPKPPNFRQLVEQAKEEARAQRTTPTTPTTPKAG